MRTVFKYALEITDTPEVEMPAGAQVLHVGVQRDEPYIWALVDLDARQETRRFFLRGTGHTVESGLKRHLGTFMLHDGEFVGHLFERGDAR